MGTTFKKGTASSSKVIGKKAANASLTDPLGLKKSKPKAAEKTAEELATERRTRSLLDKEIGDEEEKLRSLSRGRKGSASLLGKAATTRKDAASSKKSAKPKSSSMGYGSSGRGVNMGKGRR